MALTWQFYAALVLSLIAFAIIGVFIYLLLFPKKNDFDAHASRASSKPVLNSRPAPGRTPLPNGARARATPRKKR